MYQRPTAPLSIGGVLDDGFRLLKASFGKVILLAMIAAIVSNLPNFITAGMTPEETVEAMTQMGLLFLLLIPVSLVIFIAVVARINAVAENEEMSLGASIGVGLNRFFPMLGCWIVFTLAIMVGFLLLVIPGFILMISLSFAFYLVIVERQGPVEAIGNSHRLVWGNWWRTAVLMTIIMFIIAAVYMLIGVVSAAGVVVEDQAVSSGLATNVVIALAGGLVTPVTYAMWYAIFNDLRLRKEGADLEQRIGEIEGT